MSMPTAPTASSVPTTTDELMALVRSSNILSREALSVRLKTLPDLPHDPTGAAVVLVRGGVLTKFQAKQLLAGRSRGFKLGPHVIQDQIGQGGMGAVYLAEHGDLRRKVAIKILTKTTGKQDLAVERFLREARSAAALDHPNIVRIYDVVRQGELRYLVMEYVDGESLDDALRRGGAVSLGRAVDYTLQAAAGLQHAFEKGFVHRDIKPANLMLAKDGTVKILDMGLARSTSAVGDRLTEVFDKDAIVGTADYIAPEQANGDPVDIRADIYSLGVTLYNLVTGVTPFAGTTTQKLMQHQLKTAPRLSDTDPTIRPELDDIVAKMMAKRPADRYQTPAQVVTALEPWLGNASAAAEVSASTTSRSRTRSLNAKHRSHGNRTKWLFGGGACGAVVVVAGLAFVLDGGSTRTSGSGKAPPVAAAKGPPTPQPAKGGPTFGPPNGAVAGTPVYQFDPSKVDPFKLHMTARRDLSINAPGALPAPWTAESLQADRATEIEVNVVDGARLLHLRTIDEGVNIQMYTEQAIATMKPGFKYTVYVEYRAFTGMRGLLQCRGVVSGTTKDGTGQNFALKDTEGQWATAECELKPVEKDTPLLLFLHGVGRGEVMTLRSITVTEAPQK